jgi:hypothetical protein
VDFIVAPALYELLTSAAKSPIEMNPSFFLSMYLVKLLMLGSVRSFKLFSVNLKSRIVISSLFSGLASCRNL